MKRYSGLHDKLCTIENIEVAVYHTHTLIRKSIKYKIIRLVNSYLNREIDKKEFKVRMCAYYG